LVPCVELTPLLARTGLFTVGVAGSATPSDASGGAGRLVSAERGCDVLPLEWADSVVSAVLVNVFVSSFCLGDTRSAVEVVTRSDPDISEANGDGALETECGVRIGLAAEDERLNFVPVVELDAGRVPVAPSVEFKTAAVSLTVFASVRCFLVCAVVVDISVVVAAGVLVASTDVLASKDNMLLEMTLHISLPTAYLIQLF
jgi:hypothetical protein